MTAQHVCERHGINLAQKKLDIIEIQSEDPETVARDKAAKAYTAIQRPVIITDDSWAFLGLKGFPGPYMHSINEWFTPEDFLRLTLMLQDRRIVLTQCLVYDDGEQQKVFISKTEGKLLKEIRGTSAYPSHTIMALQGDNGLSIAEAYARTANKSTRASAQVWHDFIAWVKSV